MKLAMLWKVAGTVRPTAGVALACALVAFACSEPPPPPPEVMMEREGPASPFLGTWELVDWRVVEPSGDVVFPWGENPRGQIVYTDEGRMSAHLMRLPDASGESQGSEGDASGADAFQSFSYWGTFTIDLPEETVTHHVIGSSAESWVGSNQLRGFQFLGEDRVVLTAPRESADGEPAAPSRLTWVRVQ